MASLRKLNGKYANLKFHHGRGRREDGSEMDIPTVIPIEPPDLKPDDPRYSAAKAKLETQALEEVNDVEARTRLDEQTGQSEMSEEEYIARARFRAKKVLRQHVQTSPAFFIISWIWEHCVRNRLSPGRVSFICNLARLLIKDYLSKCKTIHDVRQEHFDSLVLNLRQHSYSPSFVNTAVDDLTDQSFA
jgi:hypothetical protein